jgi:hypothetical protein
MSKLYVAKSSNISLAWAEVFFRLMEPGASEMAPAVITISEFDDRSLPIEVPGIQSAIDEVNDQLCRTVPASLLPPIGSDYPLSASFRSSWSRRSPSDRSRSW